MNRTNKILIGLGIAAATGGAIFGIVKLVNRNKKGQKLNFVRNRSLSGLGMTGLNVKIPAIAQSHFKDSDIPAMKSTLADIDTKYGAAIRLYSKLTNVNEEVIKSFIFIESRGKADAQNGLSYGPMQVSTNSATDLLHTANKAGLLKNTKIQDIFKKYLGTRFDTIMKMQYNNQYGLQITAQDLLKPALNILIGTLYLRLLIDYFTENGTVRLDKVVACYNMGYSWRTKLTGPDFDTVEKTVANLNSITSSYIVKLLGKNGLLDVLTA
jgi:hypothetical protein